MFLQMMSDLLAAFMDGTLSPGDRIKKLWYVVFITRIWRNYVQSRSGSTLKKNFMSTFCYYCIELNAHSMVFIQMFLGKNNATDLFKPDMLSSQPCEQFYRQIRSLTTTYSTVTNFSVKEICDSISRIQLQNDISNDEDSTFLFPQPLNSKKASYSKNDLPSVDQIIKIIRECQTKAMNDVASVGLIESHGKTRQFVCICNVPPYSPREDDIKCGSIPKNVNELAQKAETLRLMATSSTLKNYSAKFENKQIPVTSSYVELDGKNRLVVRKTSLCWLFRNECYKSSSDRIYRVRGPKNAMKLKSRKQKSKTFKIHQQPARAKKNPIKRTKRKQTTLNDIFR